MSESSSLLLSFLAAPVLGVAALAKTGKDVLSTMDSAEEIEQRLRSRMDDLMRSMGTGSDVHLAQTEAAAQALREEQALLEVAAHPKPTGVQKMEALLAQAREASARGGGELMAAKALAAEVSVAEVISRSLQQVAEAQQRQTQIAFDRALSNLGYRVEMAAAPDRTVVLGENGDRRIVALVRRGGRVYTDMEGFQGGECLLEAQRVYEELAKEGIYPRQIDPDFHGRREGGVILARANRRQRAAGITLAQAVLEESLRSSRQARRPADVRDRQANGKAPWPARRAPAHVAEPVATTHASTLTAAQAVVWLFGRQGQRWL